LAGSWYENADGRLLLPFSQPPADARPNSFQSLGNRTGTLPGVRQRVWEGGFDRQRVNTPQEIGTARRNLAQLNV
jgi:hypothetical protein